MRTSLRYSVCSIPINQDLHLLPSDLKKLILTQTHNSIGAPLDQIENCSTCNSIANLLLHVSDLTNTICNNKSPNPNYHNSQSIALIPLVGIFQTETYYTTRSMIIIIHTKDNIFNVVQPNCLHPWMKEKNLL